MDSLFSPLPRLSILLPFYNESRYLESTLRSLLDQTRLPDQLVAIDNFSSDNSGELCRSVLGKSEIDVVQLSESRPGKINALQTALMHVNGDWIVHCDTDVYYPPHFLKQIEFLITNAAPNVNAVMAIGLPTPPDTLESQRIIADRLRLHKRFPTRCFTGGWGQTLRTKDLLEVGGYSVDLWPYVLLDHEIIHRMMKRGRSLYDRDLWCLPSERRKDRQNVRWTAFERFLYRNVPDRYSDWFFYTFLANRFATRGLSHLNLRKQPWTV